MYVCTMRPDSLTFTSSLTMCIVMYYFSINIKCKCLYLTWYINLMLVICKILLFTLARINVSLKERWRRYVTQDKIFIRQRIIQYIFPQNSVIPTKMISVKFRFWEYRVACKLCGHYHPLRMHAVHRAWQPRGAVHPFRAPRLSPRSLSWRV